MKKIVCLYSTYSSFHVINVSNQGKTLCSLCIYKIRYIATLTCLYSVVSNSSAVDGIYLVTFIGPWNLEFNLSNILSSYLTENISQLQALVGSCCTKKDCCLLWK